MHQLCPKGCGRAGMGDEEVPVPPQLRRPALHDFRAAPTNQRGFLMKNKRKLDDYAAQVSVCHVACRTAQRRQVCVLTNAHRTRSPLSSLCNVCQGSAAAC